MSCAAAVRRSRDHTAHVTTRAQASRHFKRRADNFRRALARLCPLRRPSNRVAAQALYVLANSLLFCSALLVYGSLENLRSILDFPKKLAVLVYLVAVPIVFIYVFSESIPGRLKVVVMLLAVQCVVIFNGAYGVWIRYQDELALDPLL